LQLAILLLGQAQENPAPAHCDRFIQGLMAGQIRQPAAALDKRSHLLRRSKCQRPGQGSPQILLQKLALPASAMMEEKVNAVPGVLIRHKE
jgi:hypothetical protein